MNTAMQWTWEHDTYGFSQYQHLRKDGAYTLIRMPSDKDETASTSVRLERHATAREVLGVLNSHDALVAACEAALPLLKGDIELAAGAEPLDRHITAVSQLESALRIAKGEA